MRAGIGEEHTYKQVEEIAQISHILDEVAIVYRESHNPLGYAGYLAYLF